MKEQRFAIDSTAWLGNRGLWPHPVFRLDVAVFGHRGHIALPSLEAGLSPNRQQVLLQQEATMDLGSSRSRRCSVGRNVWSWESHEYPWRLDAHRHGVVHCDFKPDTTPTPARAISAIESRLHDAQHERARGRHAPARDNRDGRLHIESLRDIYAAIGESQRAAQDPPAPSASSSSVTTCRDCRQSGVPVRGPLAEHRPRRR